MLFRSIFQKGGSNTAEFKDDLIEQLTCQTAFRLPILGDIDESVVVTWIIMAALVLVSIWLTHDLRVENPGKKTAGAGVFLLLDQRIL